MKRLSSPWLIVAAAALLVSAGFGAMTGDYWHVDFADGKIAAIWADARHADPIEIYARIGTLG